MLLFYNIMIDITTSRLHVGLSTYLRCLPAYLQQERSRMIEFALAIRIALRMFYMLIRSDQWS